MGFVLVIASRHRRRGNLDGVNWREIASSLRSSQ
jgi:hypothetical protein